MNQALINNHSLEFLDAFDVPMANQDALSFMNVLRGNSTLKHVRLANTRVTSDIVEDLMRVV